MSGGLRPLLPAPIKAGDVISLPGHSMTVLRTEFKRHGAFLDAVAEVRVDFDAGLSLEVGTHLVTPWGFVRVAEVRQ